jgi:hypothetical protein
MIAAVAQDDGKFVWKTPPIFVHESQILTAQMWTHHEAKVVPEDSVRERVKSALFGSSTSTSSKTSQL